MDKSPGSGASIVESTPSGYLAQQYAAAFAEFGEPVELRHAGGWLIKRSIAGTPYFDAMGCYPMLCCRDWSRLADDLAAIGGELVSVAAVLDPFADHDERLLKQCFPDIARPFKNHYVTDLSQARDSYIASRHARNLKKASSIVQVEQCHCPGDWLDDWTRLYGTLIERHSIRGITAFSRESFRKQLEVPGLTMFRATYAGETVGMLLWFAQGNVAYYHLGAYTPLGYELRASFALFSFVIDFFTAQGVGWLNLGAGAGSGLSEEAAEDGLSTFKRGWSTGTRTAWFCGRTFDRDRYSAIVSSRNLPPTAYFPAYRQGEFA